MNTQADEKFDFDDEIEFSEAELAEIESLSLDDDIDLDLDDDDFELELSEDELEALGEEFWNGNEVHEDASTPDLSANAPEQQAQTALETVSEDNLVSEAETVFDEIVEATPSANDLPEAISEAVEDMPPVSEPFDDDAMAGGDMLAPAIVAPAAVSAVADHTIEDEEDDQETEYDHRPVPRINIHAFCETDAFSNLVENASTDRRLLKAHLTIQMGGASKAADYFTESATPHLIILEIKTAGPELDQALMGLAEVCDPSTKVIIVGPVNDIRLYRDLMAKGISDYIVNPRRPVQLIRSISSIFTDPSAPPIGRNVAFVGTRGGVGSSTICHNVAWSIAEQLQSDTVLVDLDLPFGTAALDFEQDPSQGLAEALAAPERLDDVLLERLLQKCTDRLSLFTAPNMLDRDYDLPTESFEAVLDIVRTSAPNIIIDLPHVWTGWAQHVLRTADDIVVVATPDLASFRNTKALFESITQMRGNDQLPYLLLNQTDVPKRPEVPAEQFESDLGVKPFDTVTWDPQIFGLATTNGESIFEVGPKSDASLAINRLARTLLGLDAEETKQAKFSLKSLLGKK